MTTQAEITKLIASMSIFFPNFDLKKGFPEAYFTILGDLPYDALEAGAKAYISRDNAFFPSAGQWRKEAADIMVGRLKIPSAYEAWENVNSEMRRCGNYYDYRDCKGPDGKLLETKRPEYIHVLVQRAVEIMGYRELYMSENVMADRAHFFKVYESLLSRAVEEATQLPVVRTLTDKYAEQQLEVGEQIKQLSGRMAR